MPPRVVPRYAGRGRLYRRQNESDTLVPPSSVPGSSSDPPPSSDQPPSSTDPTSTPPPTSSEPPTSTPPTSTPPTSTPPTSTPPTSTPPTSEPPTSTPPTSTPPTSTPPTSTPPTSTPPTSLPPTSEPPTSETPTSAPPTSTSTTTVFPPPPGTTTTEVPAPPPSTSTVIITDDPNTLPPTDTATPTQATTFVQNGTTVIVSKTATGQIQSDIAHAGGKTHANIGAIVGGVLGAAAVLGAIVGLLLFCRHRQRKKRYDGVPQMPPRPSWTPLSPVATLPTLSSDPPYSDPPYERYYDAFQRYDPSGPCSTQQPEGNGNVRSNPNSQYSAYSQLSTMDTSPDSSTRQLISGGSGATAAGVAGAAAGAAAAAGAGTAHNNDDDMWHEARMYQDHYLPEHGPIDRTEHNGTPSSAYAWGAAQPKRKLGMTNPDPDTPDTPKSSFIGFFDQPDASPGASGSGAGAGAGSGAMAGAATAAATARTGAALPVSPPRPPKSDRRLSGSPLVVHTDLVDAKTEPPPLSAVRPSECGTADSDPFKWDAISAAHTALTANSAGPSQPGLAISLPPGAAQPTAGRVPVNKNTSEDTLRRQDSLPAYNPKWENRHSAGTFGDMKRELRERSADTN